MNKLMKENKELKDQIESMEKKFKEEKENYNKEISKLKDEMKQLLRNTCVTGTHNRKSPKKSTYSKIPYFQSKEDSKIIINKNSSILQFKINPKNSDNSSINNENTDSMMLKSLNDTTTNYDTSMNNFSQIENNIIDLCLNKNNINVNNSKIDSSTNKNDINNSNINNDEKSRHSYSNQEVSLLESPTKDDNDDYSEFSSRSSLQRLSLNSQVYFLFYFIFF